MGKVTVHTADHVIPSCVLLRQTAHMAGLTVQKWKLDVFNYRAEKTGKMRGCLQIPLNSPAFPREHGPDNNHLLIIH